MPLPCTLFISASWAELGRPRVATLLGSIADADKNGRAACCPDCICARNGAYHCSKPSAYLAAFSRESRALNIAAATAPGYICIGITR